MANDALTMWALGASVASDKHIGAAAVKLVLVDLCQYANSKREAWPSAERIATDLGMTRRDVRNALTLLCPDHIERIEQLPGKPARWRINADLAGYPADSAPQTWRDIPPSGVAGGVAGDLAGGVAGDLAGYPATKGSEERSEEGSASARPSPHCSDHQPNGTTAPCRACGEARRASQAWTPPARMPRDCNTVGHVWLEPDQQGTVSCLKCTARRFADGEESA